ncbi:hypothetical protein SteCoe_15379 [Stentor coeruleus]|uniref:RING-type domain-containing protein n=1 Tax=Stentor coeruleus TaxID=5963 RepID=A0A1R2C3Q9_9CILI|nr:hypothetical protein SteCoe_15379 [Stentor coeruleus]
MTCEESCMLCSLSQLYKINHSNYHGLCKSHSQNQLKTIRCIHCESLVPMLFLQDFICILCDKLLDDSEKNYGKSVCKSCLNINKSQGFVVIKTQVSNCDYCLKTPDILMYSISCKHFICQECLKNQISCPLCVLKHFGSPVSDENSILDEENKRPKNKKSGTCEKKSKSPFVIKYSRKLDFDIEKMRKSYNPSYNTVVPHAVNINPTDSEDSEENSVDDTRNKKGSMFDLDKIMNIKRNIDINSEGDSSIILPSKSNGYTQDTSTNNNSKFDHSVHDDARVGENKSTAKVFMKKVLRKICPCFYK